MLLRHRWAVILVLLPLAGCTVDTTQPLSDPVTEKPDESLYGHWVATENVDGKTDELHAFIGKHTTKANPESIMEIGMIRWDVDDKRVLSDRLKYFTVSRVGKSSYMNLLDEKDTKEFSLSEKGSYAKWTGSKKKICTIVRYNCDGKKLQLWTSKKPREALKKLSETGEVRMIHEVVTADSLVGYLQKTGGETLFDELVWSFSKAP